MSRYVVMTGSLARYHARSPRYILDTNDNNLIRFSGSERSENSSWEENTLISNISLTGLTFTSAQDLSPHLGEVIKIQFSVPGSKTMACYAIVIRITELTAYENEIAVHFYKLDRLQRINLVQGLSQKLDLVNIDARLKKPTNNKNLNNYDSRFNHQKIVSKLSLSLMMISILAWAVFLHWLFRI